MRYVIVTALLALVGAAGCATPADIQYAADRQEARARQLDAQGDHAGAAKAREAAEKQQAKAYRRSAGYL